MLKKAFMIFLSMVLVCSMGLVAFAEELEMVAIDAEFAKFERTVPKEIREAMANQYEALVAYNQIMEGLPKDDIGLPVYPDEYGGAYIEDGKLILQLTDDSNEYREYYLEACENNSKVEFKEVEYSMNELLSYKELAQELIENGIEVLGYGVDDIQNKFSIDINKNVNSASEVDNVIRTKVRGGIKQEIPVYFEYKDISETTATLKGGQGIVNERNGMGATLGVCGTYNGQNAVLTCGHGNEHNPYIKYNNERIGQVVYQRANILEALHDIDAYGDFSIIALNGNQTITNQMTGGSRIRGVLNYKAAGTVVYKYGINTGYSYGIITEERTDQIHYLGGGENGLNYCIRGLFTCVMSNDEGTHAVDEGDSGGPVFVLEGTQYMILGLVQGRFASTPNSIMYATPISYVVDVGFSVKTTD